MKTRIHSLTIHKQKKVTDTFESYKNVLDNNSIPDRIKVQLLQYLKDKYDKTRGAFDPSEDDDDGDNTGINADPNYDGHSRLLHSIIDTMGHEKKKQSKKYYILFS